MYYNAIDFAEKLSPNYFTDVVHDAFVAWYDKTERNLFDEKEVIVKNMVKKIYWKKYFNRSKVPVVSFNERMSHVMSPEDEYISKEIGITFATYDEIDSQVKNYEQYHVIYPKIHLN